MAVRHLPAPDGRAAQGCNISCINQSPEKPGPARHFWVRRAESNFWFRSLARSTKSTRLKEKLAKLKEEMQRLKALDVQMLATPDQQISLTDPDARSMATSGRGSGVVIYDVQVAVDTKHHLIITHEVTNVGTDQSQLAHIAKDTKATLGVETSMPSPTAATSAASRSWRARKQASRSPCQSR